MAIGKDGSVGLRLRTLYAVGVVRERTDGQLLERFTAGRDEGAGLAFAALVERHGPMVLRVARGVLDDPHDAEDAFQATFLVLVARAKRLRVRDSLGPWLHQVAHRTALCMRANAARRRRLDRGVVPAEPATRPDGGDDLARVIHEEIARLPERYRVAVVLCDLEGQTHEQAARTLGWPVGTVKSRQARARDRLRDRLARRGVAPGLGLVLNRPAFVPSLAMTLVDSTTAAAVRSVASRALVPGPAAALALEVIRAMTILRWAKAAPFFLALGVAASGVALVAQGQGQGDRPIEPSPATPAADPATVEIRPGKLDFSLAERGVVEPSKSLDVYNQVEGSTAIVRISPDGTRVKKGAVVAELDSATLRDQLINQRVATTQAESAFQQARLAREVAEIAVKEFTDGIKPRELATLDGKVALARAGVARGQDRLARDELARKRFDQAIGRRAGPETPGDIIADLALADRLDDARDRLEARRLDLETTMGQLDLLKQYSLDKTTRRLQVEVEKARSDELARQSAWELEKSRIAKVERQIQACTLVAPGDGYLVHANDPGRVGGRIIQIEEGANVRERQKLFRVIDLSEPMRINTKVHEALVDRVEPGQRVRIKVEAFPNQALTGVVRAVAPRPDPTAFNAEGKQKLYTTYVQIDQGVPDLRPGMTAAVAIELFALDDVLAVPIASVVSLDGKDRVAVRTTEGAIELREVTLGKSNDKAVEVKQGLRPGDRVFLDPMARPVGPR